MTVSWGLTVALAAIVCLQTTCAQVHHGLPSTLSVINLQDWVLLLYVAAVDIACGRI